MSRMGELEAAHDWLGVVALEHEALALAQELRGTDPGRAGATHGILGLGFQGVGQYARAREMYEQDRAICEALGDRAGVASACSALGNCYHNTGDYGQARELHDQAKAIFEGPDGRRDEGVKIDVVAQQLNGRFTEAQVREAVEHLVNEGHLYSTIDDDHFKSTNL